MIDAIDMQVVVRYGKEKGIGVWIYVNQHALMKQMDKWIGAKVGIFAITPQGNDRCWIDIDDFTID